MTKLKKILQNVQRNSVLARNMGVSEPTVGKWLENAQAGKNNLQYTMINGRYYFLDNEHNRDIMYMLRDKGAKFRNKVGYEMLKPDSKFYKIFNQSQIVEIVTSLENQLLIPYKYTYFDQGAGFWEKSQINQKKKSDSQKELELVTVSLENLHLKLKDFETINIVEIGPATQLTRIILDKFLQEKQVNYTNLSLSPQILKGAKNNLNEWYPKLHSKFQLTDIESENIRDLLFFNKHRHETKACNLILFFSCGLGYFADRHHLYKNLFDSLSNNDFLWLSNNLQINNEQFLIKCQEILKNPWALQQSLWLPKLLGLIEKNHFELQTGFNPKIDSYALVMKLKKDVDIKFSLEGRDKILSFAQDKEIIIWNYFAHIPAKLTEEINKVGFVVTDLTTYPDNTLGLVMCQREEI